MHFNKVNKGILPLIFIVGLFKITGIESVENQKGKQDDSTDYDYSEEGEVATNGDANVPNSLAKPTMGTKPFFENKLNIVYASHEGENVTLHCAPKKFNEAKHTILWYRDDLPITNGNITLVVGNFDVDNKHSLTIYNFTSQTPLGNFSCRVLPADVRQYMRIELNAPDNISEQNAAAANGLMQILGLAMIALSLTFSTLY